MPALLTPQRWTVQPQYHENIDSGNPITRGLVFAWEASSDHDSVKKARYTRDSTGVSRSAGKNGVQFNYSSDAVSDFGTLDLLQGATQSTVCVDVYFATASPSSKPINQWDSGFNQWLVQLNAGGLVWVAAQDVSGNRRRWDMSSFIAAIGWYRLIFIWGGGATKALFRNGVDVTASLTDVNAVATSINTNASPMYMGRSGAFPGTQLNGSISGARIWNRALSTAEALSINANPYQVFSPRLI